jgi:bifunctional enzyme CysN/CysC
MRVVADTHREIVQEGLEKELLRFTTAGSVDDGKSTLIGRLLYDSKAIFEDQYEALERSSQLRGAERVDLAHLTDGLRAEREQGITIDVAYRYFETPKRKFIIADTPGHEQYTRNMVTGASTADLAVVLVDARNGVITQSKRHGFIASLLGIPHVLVAVNKMDLVDYSQEVFEKIVSDYTAFSRKLNIHDLTFVPISALEGDNVVERSERMPWYQGFSVLHYLENVTIAADSNLVDFRFPVQYVVRPHQDFRGYAGKIKSGVIRPGEEVMVLPSRKRSTIERIVTYDGELEEAGQEESVTIELADQLDISRGDMLVRPNNMPRIADNFDAIVNWMDDHSPLEPGKEYILQHAGRTVKARVEEVLYKIDVNTLHRQFEKRVELNEIARLELRTGEPLFFDPYATNRSTGSFVLIDPASLVTVGAGMMQNERRAAEVKSEALAIAGSEPVSAAEHAGRAGHRGLCLLFGPEAGGQRHESPAGRLAEAERLLFARGWKTARVDTELYARITGRSVAPRPEEYYTFVYHLAAAFLETAHLVCVDTAPLTMTKREELGLVLGHDRAIECEPDQSSEEVAALVKNKLW